MALTGRMLNVTPACCILGAAGRDFHAATRVLNGWVGLPVETLPVYLPSIHSVLSVNKCNK